MDWKESGAFGLTKIGIAALHAWFQQLCRHLDKAINKGYIPQAYDPLLFCCPSRGRGWVSDTDFQSLI